MSQFTMDLKQMDDFADTIGRFANGYEAEQIINDYLQGEGGDIIAKEIRGILPASGRKWKGKAPAARSVMPFKKESKENLSVTVKTTKKYHYLYFPDDGSSTARHQGNQQFMFDGASRKAEEIGDKVLERLIERLEE